MVSRIRLRLLGFLYQNIRLGNPKPSLHIAKFSGPQYYSVLGGYEGFIGAWKDDCIAFAGTLFMYPPGKQKCSLSVPIFWTPI